MSLSAINSVSTGFYDTLTSPFIIKKVTINSHTPYDTTKYVPSSFSRYDFGGIQSTTSTKLQVKTYNIGAINLDKSSNNIVKDLISNGYSAKNAIDMQKAINAYGFNALNSNGVSTLSTNSYEI